MLLQTVLLFSTAVLGQATGAQAGTAKTENERLSKFQPSDFVLDLKRNQQFQQLGNGGSLSPMNAKSLPPLFGHHIALNLISLEPCAMNRPHLHPRATEAIYAIRGENILLGFIPENGGKVTLNKVKDGQATFFPQAYIHFEFNDNCKRAQLLAALNSHDPGTLTVNAQFFKLPDQTLAASIGFDNGNINQIAGKIDLGEFPGLGKECRKRCGLDLPAPFDQDGSAGMRQDLSIKGSPSQQNRNSGQSSRYRNMKQSQYTDNNQFTLPKSDMEQSSSRSMGQSGPRNMDVVNDSVAFDDYL